MADLVYPREKSLGLITLVLGLVAWLVIILATLGTALIYLLFGFIFYLFAQSGLIAWLRGTGVRVSHSSAPHAVVRREHTDLVVFAAEGDQPFRVQRMAPTRTQIPSTGIGLLVPRILLVSRKPFSSSRL